MVKSVSENFAFSNLWWVCKFWNSLVENVLCVDFGNMLHKLENQDKDKLQENKFIEQHAPIYSGELKLYQASSKRAIIPIGFWKCI